MSLFKFHSCSQLLVVQPCFLPQVLSNMSCTICFPSPTTSFPCRRPFWDLRSRNMIQKSHRIGGQHHEDLLFLHVSLSPNCHMIGSYVFATHYNTLFQSPCSHGGTKAGHPDVLFDLKHQALDVEETTPPRFFPCNLGCFSSASPSPSRFQKLIIL